MRAKVQKWGNRLTIPIPVALEVGLRAESNHREYTLAELVRDITPKNRHEETDFGPPVGREIL
jgi:antitoxin component of MazEF toxin-antitoxin module